MKPRGRWRPGWLLPLTLLITSTAHAAENVSPLASVVGVAARVAPDARTAEILGRHRFGAGVVIDGSGLVVTAGYLLLEASDARLVMEGERVVPADVVAYDHRSGFGLLRAREALGVKPMPLGDDRDTAAGTPVLIASYGGEAGLQPGLVVSRHEFAGFWEYLLEDALFVSPPHPRFAGAALIDPSGRLVGIGSLMVRDARGDGSGMAGSVFLPVSLLREVLPALLADGRSDSPPTPWLGVYLDDDAGVLTVTRLAEEGPAAIAGMAAGDVVVAIDGKPVHGLAEFYRRLWGLGPAGVEITLEVLRDAQRRSVSITSTDRYRWLRFPTPP